MTRPAPPPGEAPARWRVVIDGFHPTRINEMIGRSWHVVRRLKRHDRSIICAHLKLAGVPPATGRRRLRLTIVLAPRQRAGDPDAYFKSLLDACVEAGALVDDNRQGVELMPAAFERADREATVIELEDL